jgi:hypothetical protein
MLLKLYKILVEIPYLVTIKSRVLDGVVRLPDVGSLSLNHITRAEAVQDTRRY